MIERDWLFMDDVIRERLQNKYVNEKASGAFPTFGNCKGFAKLMKSKFKSIEFTQRNWL
jgi:hypothetical protein